MIDSKIGFDKPTIYRERTLSTRPIIKLNEYELVEDNNMGSVRYDKCEIFFLFSSDGAGGSFQYFRARLRNSDE